MHLALQKWALVAQEKMASPLDNNPDYPYYWSADPRNAVFGAHTMPYHPNFLVSQYATLSTMTKL